MSDTTRKVCPTCKTDDRLYSCERVVVMYPIAVRGAEVDYSTDDWRESDTLHDTGEFTDDLYCRGCDSELTLSDLIDAPSQKGE